ncbi:flagellar biosynthesis protein FlgE [Bordetella genomosp. 1]|uniref:Flagellar hook protein FlgE n=1 Tax=Bordetella genomosp. 1 TaxID=1395607 RepID=A0A261S5G3_9BORD|nr:flagellar hook protein FlgE [Bordetella genomosp. 1]MDQ8032378.1 flagellar hook protein FlgE [Bordetella sp.]OZI32608.1 flagellar biosynthesis protein FlgE [Bordetella genomosp. 1]OZI66031.1 flagellar biosynthesis protein FlgE [Bordetella genomosp. 1]
MGFGQGLSGLNAASQNLDVIGNNIANSGTVGFKSGSASFADVYASSRVGLGVKVSAINQRFTVGNVTSTGGEYDIAIDGAKGFFRLLDPSGSVFYSRNGEFGIDKDFRIVNAQGYQLTGYPPGGIGAAPVGLTLPQGNIAPRATDGMTVQTNLDANATAIDGTVTPFDATDNTTYTTSVPYTVYDSLGNSHQMTQFFVKRPAAAGESVYDVYYQLDGQDMTVGAAADPNATFTFNSAGVMTTTPASVTINYATPGGTTSPAAPMAIVMNYAGTTQYGSDFNPKMTQTGYSSGEFSGITIGKDGSLEAKYTNGESQTIGTIVLANFNNVQGLQPVGNNAWAETADSGQAVLGQPGTNGLSTLAGQALEASNVDMSKELVNMIVAQRTYQANAQTIKTQDEIMQVLMNMR